MTIDTLNVLESGAGDATATITASAASGFKVDVIDLINTGGAGGVVGISAITVSGAGAVEIGDGTGAFFNTLDTLVTSTVTGGFILICPIRHQLLISTSLLAMPLPVKATLF